MNDESFRKTRRIYLWALKYVKNTHGIHEHLRTTYTPIRCLGDTIVHSMITLLSDTTLTEGEQYTAANEFYNSLDEDGRRLWDICWRYIRHTLKQWLDNGSVNVEVPTN